MNKADSALNAIPPAEDYSEWIRQTAAYKAAGGSFDVWYRWCQTGSDPIKESEAPKKWNSISSNGRIGEGTLYWLAYQYGWKPEKSEGWKTIKRKEEKVEVEEKKPISKEAIAKLHKTLQQSQKATDPGVEYLKSRGISEEICKQFKIGYIEGMGVVIPFPGADTPYYVTRSTAIAPNTKDAEQKNKRYRFPSNDEAGEKQLFNVPALNSTDGGIFITEGQIDCLSVESMGFPCIGCNEASQLIKAIEKHGTTAAYFKIIPDNDTEGERKKERLLDALKEAGIEAYICSLPEHIHDANAFLMNDAATFWEWCQSTNNIRIREYQKKNGTLEALAGLVGKQDYPAPISTGFAHLDKQLDGGFFPGLYLLAAIPSLGKTTLAIQIADQAAAKGHDVLIFSLEMTKKELIAKSISRLTTKEKNPNDRKTARSILRSDQWYTFPPSGQDAIFAAISEYKKFGNQIFIKDGLGDITAAMIREQITEHIRITGKKPLVIVDYIQIIAPHNDKASERQVLDYNTLEMKRISRDIEIPVICITALNRTENASGATMNALKGSGGLDYTADVVMFLQVKNAGKHSKASDGKLNERENRAAQQEQASQDKRELEIELLKNRHGGRSKKIQFTYEAAFNLYEEKGAVDPQYGPDNASSDPNFTPATKK